MALILARSPYLIGRQGFDNNATLELELLTSLVLIGSEICIIKNLYFKL
jgi:hypothetical protein